jgi:hypothetical protein
MSAVARRLSTVAQMQDQMTATIAEQTDIAARTRASVIAAAEHVGASVAEIRTGGEVHGGGETPDHLPRHRSGGPRRLRGGFPPITTGPAATLAR